MASAPTTLTHQLISASAGSGKTYQLVRRYLHLLALGQPAEGVAAMTFTRKAAGEFFSRILQGLAAMAEKPETAALFFEGVQPPLPPGQDFGVLLRTVARRLHRLQLSTLDSFFAKVAACFPMELGLPAGARVMDEDETRMARREALDALLDRLYLEDQNTALQTLMEAYKQATFGSEDKTVEATLQDWLADGLTLWEDSAVTPASAEEPPAGEAGALWGAGLRGWGSPREIWPQPLQAGDLMAAIEEV
ncbi:MAG TPA: UvrD-helicase domain-containing protein, partial [Prosthecobacter sp.]